MAPPHSFTSQQGCCKVSVLIRSTGRPELERALDSVAAQTYPNVETLVVDASGCSAVKLPVKHQSAVRLLDGGVALLRSAAANQLLEAASGQFGLFLDDDDWMAPEHLARLVEALAAAPECQLAYAGTSCVRVEGLVSDCRVVEELRVYDEPFDPVRLLTENYIPIHAALFRLAPVRTDARMRFRESLELFEDWDFWLQNLEVGPFLHVPGISAYYCLQPGSGAGVLAQDERAAIDALDAVIAHWRMRLSAEAMRELVVRARQANAWHVEIGRLTRESAGLRRELAELRASSEQELASLRAWYEGSRSWRITRPLRATADRLRDWRRSNGALRARAARGTLAVLTRAYRHPQLYHMAAFLPVNLRRRLRNALLRRASADSTHAPVGLHLVQPLGSKPKVSIIIPVYNHAAYLVRCLESALAQTWEPCEIIVVDDASTDPEVGRILSAYRNRARMRIERNERNLGISETQNRALCLSSGQIIGFLDCDDYLAPDAVERCVEHWRDDTVYLHTGRINVDANDVEVSRIHFLSLPRENYFEENLRAMFATHFKLIRRDVFARVGLFDSRYDTAQDYDLLLRVAFHYPTTSFVHLPEFLYYHRLHAAQDSERQSARQAALTEQIRCEARLRADIRAGRYHRMLSIVMLSYGKHTQTLAALQGLQATVRVPHEIILYDNGSAAETVEFIRRQIEGRFPTLRVIYGERNLGPAQGRRTALEHARGEWFIVFDNDEIPESGWLEEVLVRGESRPDVGAVCCKVAFPNRHLQFSGGKVEPYGEDMIVLGLHDRDALVDDLSTCVFRELDWSPIGATLFTRNVAPWLHDGYPNVFEDAAVSYALRRQGLCLLNAPGALVWHEHIMFRPDTEMSARYLADRYNPRLMLKSVASFYSENGLIIHDEYIWRENRLFDLDRDQLLRLLAQQLDTPTDFGGGEGAAHARMATENRKEQTAVHD